MALLYQAELHPKKLELLTAWLPTRLWYRGSAAPILRRVAAFRFDNPAGEVGIETLIVQVADGPLLQVGAGAGTMREERYGEHLGHVVTLDPERQRVLGCVMVETQKPAAVSGLGRPPVPSYMPARASSPLSGRFDQDERGMTLAAPWWFYSRPATLND